MRFAFELVQDIIDVAPLLLIESVGLDKNQDFLTGSKAIWRRLGMIPIVGVQSFVR